MCSLTVVPTPGLRVQKGALAHVLGAAIALVAAVGVVVLGLFDESADGGPVGAGRVDVDPVSG
ncbi:hypothetical protein GCM10023169_08120 [Georgenia halophila]|uniref:Uncharacterized protein n=1 Tax=Georgenia halophila TaxID=620889 RepID=A0ABP8KXV2_9MICO